MKFPIYLEASKLSSNSQKAGTLQKTKLLGEAKSGKVVYNKYEAMFLIDSGKAEVVKGKKKVSENQLARLFSRGDKDFYIKYLVFKKLKSRGYIVKTGLKFGVEFRAYEKNSKHAKYLVYPVKQVDKVNWKEFISVNRIAHSTAKKMLVAVVDSEDSVIFYEVGWLKI